MLPAKYQPNRSSSSGEVFDCLPYMDMTIFIHLYTTVELRWLEH